MAQRGVAEGVALSPATPPSVATEACAVNRRQGGEGGAPFTCRRWLSRSGLAGPRERETHVPPPPPRQRAGGVFEDMHKTKTKKENMTRHLTTRSHLATRGGRGGHPAWPARSIQLARRSPFGRCGWTHHRAGRLVARIRRWRGQRGPDAWPLLMTRDRATAESAGSPAILSGERHDRFVDLSRKSSRSIRPSEWNGRCQVATSMLHTTCSCPILSVCQTCSNWGRRQAGHANRGAPCARRPAGLARASGAPATRVHPCAPRPRRSSPAPCSMLQCLGGRRRTAALPLPSLSLPTAARHPPLTSLPSPPPFLHPHRAPPLATH